MSDTIIRAIESAASQLTERAGTSQGEKLDPWEAVRLIQGDDLLALTYAALFFPSLTMSNGIPVAQFATSDHEFPLDCFHVDLLHAYEAPGTSPDIYAALGQTLAEAWTHALRRQGLGGRFQYDSSSGFDVVYEP